MTAALLILGLALAAPSDEVIAACDRAVEAQDGAALQTCVEAWVGDDPRDPRTDWYAFHLGIVHEDTTAAVSARNRAISHGIDYERARFMQVAELPYNPMLTVQRVLLAVILLLGGVGMVWARWRAMRGEDG